MPQGMYSSSFYYFGLVLFISIDSLGCGIAYVFLLSFWLETTNSRDDTSCNRTVIQGEVPWKVGYRDLFALYLIRL